uniref:TruB pseudouridine synthase family member 2 n=1 Tax=Ovis aries TaxID=9940 RepID=A0AC11EH84_SHEEP
AGLARLQGLFAVYKPPGLKWKHLRDTVELQLLKGLNAGKPPAPKQRVRFLLEPVESSKEKELTLTANRVPTLIDHPLVRGLAFTSLKVGVGHRLDSQASGVLVLGVGHGCGLLTDMYNAHLTKDLLHVLVRHVSEHQHAPATVGRTYGESDGVPSLSGLTV